MRIRTLACLALLIVPALASGQKKPLTQSDWDKWKSIQGTAISNDGSWAMYSLVPQVGDGELIVRSLSGGREIHVPRGYLGRPNNVPGGLRPRAGANPEEAPSGVTVAPGEFTADSRFVVVLTYPAQAEFDRAVRNRRPRHREPRRWKDHDGWSCAVVPAACGRSWMDDVCGR